jgi:hypothetical protein
MAALQHVQKTLIELKVLGSCKYLGFYRMVSFKKLKTLEIPLAFLAGLSASVPPTHIDEALPTTVEHVALSDDFCKEHDWRGQQQLEVFSLWMDNLKTVTSRLRRFVWVTMLRDTVVEWHNKSVLKARILAVYGKAGVEVEVVQRYDNLERKHLSWD